MSIYSDVSRMSTSVDVRRSAPLCLLAVSPVLQHSYAAIRCSHMRSRAVILLTNNFFTLKDTMMAQTRRSRNSFTFSPRLCVHCRSLLGESFFSFAPLQGIPVGPFFFLLLGLSFALVLAFSQTPPLSKTFSRLLKAFRIFRRFEDLFESVRN